MFVTVYARNHALYCLGHLQGYNMLLFEFLAWVNYRFRNCADWRLHQYKIKNS